jgi:ATP-dependent exoDNAse (exonuclease V) beta subunit
MSRSAAATIEAFIHDRSLAVQALGQPRPRESWRRLRYVVAQATRWAEAGDPTLRGMLDWLERLQKNMYYDTESAVPEADEDAVRLLTIHGAKGLESPVVVLSGLGAGKRPADSVQIVPDYLGSQLAVRCGGFQTPDWDADREKELAEAETLRLWYVAATRAREHLVISLFRNANTSCPAARIAEILETSDVHGVRRIEPPAYAEIRENGLGAYEVETASVLDYVNAENEWSAQRSEQLRRMGTQRVVAPSGLHVNQLPDDAGVPSNGSGRAFGSALGLAVHAVLQRVDLESLIDLEILAGDAAQVHAVDPEVVAAHARRAALSPPVRQALESGRLWREVSVGIREGDTLIEGTIDLLKELGDGTLGVVDYKTDRATKSTLPTHAQRYALQGGAYAVAVQRATGRTVSSLEFVFTSLPDAGVIRYESHEVAELMNRAIAAARAGELSTSPAAG